MSDTQQPAAQTQSVEKDIELVFSGRRYRLSSKRPQAIKKIPEPDRSTLLMLLEQLQPKVETVQAEQAAIDLDLLADTTEQSQPTVNQNLATNPSSANAAQATTVQATTGQTMSQSATQADANPTPKSSGDIAALMASLAEQERAEMNKRMNTKAVWKWFGIIVLVLIGLIVLL